MENRSAGRQSRRRKRTAASEPRLQANAFTLDGSSGPRPGFGFLDDAAIALLKARAFDLLEDYGVVVIHPKGAEALLGAGAKPGRDGDRLRKSVV